MKIKPEFLIFCSHCERPNDITKVKFTEGFITNSLSKLPDHDDKRWYCNACGCLNTPEDVEFEERLEHNGDGEEIL